MIPAKWGIGAAFPARSSKGSWHIHSGHHRFNRTRDRGLDLRGTLFAEGDYILGLDAHKKNAGIGGQMNAGLTAQGQRGRQIGVVARRCAEWEWIDKEAVDGTRRRAGADGIDEDGAVEADETFHQPQAAQEVLVHFEIGTPARSARSWARLFRPTLSS